MTTIEALCSNCKKQYVVPAERAGKRFKCTGCGESVSVPGAASAAAVAPPEPAAAVETTSTRASEPTKKPAGAKPAGSAAARRAPREAPAEKKSSMPLILGGVVAVAALGAGAFFMFKGKDPAAPAGGSGAQTAQNAGKTAGSVAPKVEAPKDPLVIKKEEYTKILAEAEKKSEVVAALLEVAIFCLKEPKLEKEAKGIYEKVIEKDTGNATAREFLGYKKYDGDTADAKGTWVTSARFDELTAADTARREEEEKKRLAEEKRANDPFVKAAKVRIDEMQKMIDQTNTFAKDAASKLPDDKKDAEELDINKFRKSDEIPAKFQFFYDCKQVPKPYLIAVQEDGVMTPDKTAETFGEMLDALRRTFYRRYETFVGLRDLSSTPVPVWVFRSKGQYERWRRAGNGGPSTESVGAFYTGTAKNNAAGMLYLWLRDSREEKTFVEDPILQIQDTLWHEGTHQLMDFNSPGRGFSIGNTPWMQEGFAEYVGTHRRVVDTSEKDGWRYFFGVPNPGRRQEIYGFGSFSQKADEETFVEATPSLKEVVHCDYPQFWLARSMQESKESGTEAQKARQMISGVYAYGWALCHYLQHAEEGKYRDQFHKWFQLELEKKSSAEDFEQIFGLTTNDKWKAFEADFQNWLTLTMRRDFKDASELKYSLYEKYQKQFEAAIAAGAKKPARSEK